MPRLTSSRLVGRSAELALLERAFDLAAEGELSFVLLTGEAGIGKTRLVQEHVAAVRARGSLALVGETIPLGDTSLPFGPFLDALGPGAAGLPDGAAVGWASAPGADEGGQASRGLDAGDVLAAQAALYASVVGTLDRLASDRAVLLVLEDLHWADPATRDLLAYLVRRLRGSPIQVIGTVRSDALHRRHPLLPFIAEASRWSFTDRIELARLDRQATAELVGELLGEPPGRVTVERVLDRSDGIPFFVESVVAEESGRVGGAGLATDLLVARLVALSPAARRLLNAAAVLGRRPAHDLLVEITGASAEAVIAPLRECVEARLLTPARHGGASAYEFRHALLQEVAYDGLLPAERVALHRRAATALAAGVDLSGDVPVALAGEIAHHASRAHDLRLALEAADAAGRAAMAALAFTDADVYFDQALELWEQVRGNDAGGDLAGLVARAALAAGYANQPARAVRYDRRRLELEPDAAPEHTATILHEMFWHLWDAGAIDELVVTAERAVALLPTAPPTAARARALADLGFARWSVCQNQAAASLAHASAAAARAVGDETGEGTALFVLGLATAGLGQTRTADPIFARAFDQLSRSGDPDGAARVAHWWSNTLELDGSHEEALRVGEEGLVAARVAGVDLRHGDAIRAVIAENLEHLGRWDEALVVAADGFNWGTNQPSEIWSHAVHARIAVCRGQLDGARRHIDAAGAVQAAGPDKVWQAEELMNLAYALSEVEQARAHRREGVAATPSPDHEIALWWLLVRALDAEVELALAARAVGDRHADERATAEALACADLLEANVAWVDRHGGGGPLIAAFATWTAALRSRLEQRPDVATWALVVERLDAIGTVWYAARARCRLAEALVLRGAPAGEVAPVLAAVREMALYLETPPLLAEAERLARVAGVRPDGREEPPEAPGAARLASLGLSRRELEVVGLVAAGRSNREIAEALFISPKTASVHVSNILAKLGVATRVEAALVASRAGLAAPDPEGRPGA